MTWQQWGTKARKCRHGLIYGFDQKDETWSSYDDLGQGYKTIVGIIKAQVTKETTLGNAF